MLCDDAFCSFGRDVLPVKGARLFVVVSYSSRRYLAECKQTKPSSPRFPVYPHTHSERVSKTSPLQEHTCSFTHHKLLGRLC
jgi:hypothetical protein